MMFDAFGIIPGRIWIDAQPAKDGFDDFVASAGCYGQTLSLFGEKDATVGALRNQVLLGKALEHLGDRRLRYPEPLRNVGLASFAGMLYQVGNQLDIIFHQFRAAIVSAFLKSFGMRLDFR